MASAEIVPPAAATRPDTTNVARCPKRPMPREAKNVVSPAATNSRLKGSVASSGRGATRRPDDAGQGEVDARAGDGEGLRDREVPDDPGGRAHRSSLPCAAVRRERDRAVSRAERGAQPGDAPRPGRDGRGATTGALDIATLARLACCSPSHFIRTFAVTFGETPHRYLQRRRVERAMFLLRSTPDERHRRLLVRRVREPGHVQRGRSRGSSARRPTAYRARGPLPAGAGLLRDGAGCDRAVSEKRSTAEPRR